MGTFNPSMQKATLSAIDSDVHGLISKRTAELDGVSVTEVTFAPGARWSNDLKSYAGTELCALARGGRARRATRRPNGRRIERGVRGW